MARIRWTSAALRQLDSLLDSLAAEDAETAVSVGRRIDAAIARLASFPESAPVYVKRLRRLSVPGLPYSCYYELFSDEVRIIHIRHDKLSPLQ